jgi:hypothetical protein
MTVTPTDVLVGTGALMSWLFYKLFWPRRSPKEPGPHNNWHVKKSTTAESGWVESGEGYGGGDGDGGGATNA